MHCSILPPHPTISHNLPDFRSLIIQGPYLPSAPIHLCLSHLSSDVQSQKALLLSSSSSYLSKELEEYNDAWLTKHAGHGAVAERLHQIDIFYPPTHRHFRLLLARLRTFSTSNVDSGSEIDLKTCLLRAPTLLVVHEPSRYFLVSGSPDDSETQEYELPTLSTYMQLIIEAIATLRFLYGSINPSNPPRLVIFDTQLHTLVLPILRPVDVGGMAELPQHLKARVVDVLQRYIGSVGTVEKIEDEEIPSSQADEIELNIDEKDANEGAVIEKTRFRMSIRKSPDATFHTEPTRVQTFEWYSYRDTHEPPFTPHRRTIVVPL